jgi:chromosome segregation ATPase
MKSLLALAFVAVGLVVPGCQSTGADQASAVADKLRTLASELESGKGEIDAAIGATKIDAKGDLKAQYRNYVSKIDDLESQAKTIRALRTDIEESRDQYVQSARMQNAVINNTDLRKKGEAVTEELVEKFNALREKCDASRAHYDAMLKDLKDVAAYLDHNLNPAGIEAVEDSKEGAAKHADELKKGIDDVNADLKKLADGIDIPAPPPPEAAAPAKG